MQDKIKAAVISELRRVLKRMHYPLEVMLVCTRWYAAYLLSFRHLEEMMQERGVFVDHSTVHRWVLKIPPIMVLIFRRRKLPTGNSCRTDETKSKLLTSGSTCTVQSARVAPTPRPFAASMTMPASILNWGSPSISTTSSSRITGQ